LLTSIKELSLSIHLKIEKRTAMKFF
jgi:hypothetical protein